MTDTPHTVNAYGVDPNTIDAAHADRVAHALGLSHAVRIGCGGFLHGISRGVLTITPEPFDLRNPRIVSVPWALVADLEPWGWLPIGTAPKDSTRVLISGGRARDDCGYETPWVSRDGQVDIGYWESGRWYGEASRDGHWVHEPTLWMPLPETSAWSTSYVRSLNEAALARLTLDALRYRWLRRTAPEALLMIAWRTPAACEVGGDCDAAIDAARAEGRSDG